MRWFHGFDQPMPSHWQRWRPFVGLVAGAAALVWLFHDMPLQRFLGSLNRLQWRWILLAIVIDVASYACQGYRWKLLLRPIGALSWLRSTRAIFVGLFTNEIMPMRPGEAVRAGIVAKWLDVRFSDVLPSILVERLFDGVWWSLWLGLTAMLVPLPGGLRHAGDTLGAVVLAATMAFVFVVVRAERNTAERQLTQSRGPREASRTRIALRRFADGLRQIGLSRTSGIAFVLSLVFLTGQFLAFWLAIRGYGVPLGFWPGVATMLIVNLGTAVPNAPANLGTYQLACAAGLVLFGIDKSTAAGASVVVFVLLTVPLWILGALALSSVR
jgi:glycosyltransferase 2 family protein